MNGVGDGVLEVVLPAWLAAAELLAAAPDEVWVGGAELDVVGVTPKLRA